MAKVLLIVGIQEGNRSFNIHGSAYPCPGSGYEGTGSVIHFDGVTGRIETTPRSSAP